jgi:uncharacterized membrane protein (UPF0127 family)
MKSALITIILLTNVFVFEPAATEKDRERGMMNRKSWGSIDGMIFIHEKSGPVAYWMKNTYLPMAMLFMDTDLNILEVHNPKPLSTDIVASEHTNIKYVLELNPSVTNIFFHNFNELRIKLREKLEDNEKEGGVE